MKPKASPNYIHHKASSYMITKLKADTESNLLHLLCSTGLHALGFGVLHGPTVACIHC